MTCVDHPIIEIFWNLLMCLIPVDELCPNAQIDQLSLSGSRMLGNSHDIMVLPFAFEHVCYRKC